MLDILTNLSNSIGELINNIKEDKKQDLKSNSKSILGGGFFGGKISKTINIIKKDVTTIKKDIKNINKNQTNILNILKKSKDKNNAIDGLLEDKNKRKRLNLKEGIGTIGLMAGAILALGTAFKIIGNVDFASVLALSISLPLLAIAFEKIAQIKNLNPAKVGQLLLVTLGISAALVASSIILQNIQTLTLSQLGSMIATGTALGIATYLMTPILTSSQFNKITPAQMLTFPVVLLGIAAALVGASYAFQYFQPIDTSILLNIALSGLAFGLAATALAVPIAIVAWSINKVGGIGNFLLGSIGIIAMAGVFALSSIIIGKGDYNNPIPMGFALSFSISMALLAIPVVIMGSVSPVVVAMGAIGLVLVAGGIALASRLLAYADFDAMKNMADVMAYSIGKLLQYVVPFLLPIGQSLAHFIDLIEPPISRFVAGVFPLLINMIQVIGDILMPAIMSIIDGLCNILPNLAAAFNSVANIIEKVGNSISSIINNISSGIVNIITSITDSIMKLNELSYTQMAGIGAGLLLIATGFGAIGAALMIDGIGSLFGGDSILDKLLDITKNATNLILAGKGVQYLATALSTLSDFDSKNIKKVNDIVNSLSSVSMAELAKNSGMVVTLSPADLKTLLSDGDSKISVLPNNIKEEQQQQVTSVSSPTGGVSDILLNQLVSQQVQTNIILSEIAKDTKSFNKLYNEIKTSKNIKEPKNK